MWLPILFACAIAGSFLLGFGIGMDAERQDWQRAWCVKNNYDAKVRRGIVCVDRSDPRKLIVPPSTIE